MSGMDYTFLGLKDLPARHAEITQSGDEERVARMHVALNLLPGILHEAVYDFERYASVPQTGIPLDECGRPRPS